MEPNYDSAEALFWEDKRERASAAWRELSNTAADLGRRAREAGNGSREFAAYWALRRASREALAALDAVDAAYAAAIWGDED